MSGYCARAAIEVHVPRNQPGARRTDDRRVISGMVHMPKKGGRWQDCPACDGPPATIDNRYHRWSRRGIWLAIFAAPAAANRGGMRMIDSITAKARGLAAGGNGG